MLLAVLHKAANGEPALPLLGLHPRAMKTHIPTKPRTRTAAAPSFTLRRSAHSPGASRWVGRHSAGSCSRSPTRGRDSETSSDRDHLGLATLHERRQTPHATLCPFHTGGPGKGSRDSELSGSPGLGWGGRAEGLVTGARGRQWDHGDVTELGDSTANYHGNADTGEFCSTGITSQ